MPLGADALQHAAGQVGVSQGGGSFSVMSVDTGSYRASSDQMTERTNFSDARGISKARARPMHIKVQKGCAVRTWVQGWSVLSHRQLHGAVAPRSILRAGLTHTEVDLAKQVCLPCTGRSGRLLRAVWGLPAGCVFYAI